MILKRKLNIVSIKVRWPEETRDVYCPNTRTRKGNFRFTRFYDQFLCQKFCEDDPECVGFAWTKTEKSTCYLCLDDVLTYRHENYGFYRKPLGNIEVNAI